jgi:hypothetical protein
VQGLGRYETQVLQCGLAMAHTGIVCGGFNSNDGGRVDIKHIKMFLVSDVGMTMNTKFPWLRG